MAGMGATKAGWWELGEVGLLGAERPGRGTGPRKRTKLRALVAICSSRWSGVRGWRLRWDPVGEVAEARAEEEDEDGGRGNSPVESRAKRRAYSPEEKGGSRGTRHLR
jgi:hypothetical protein